MRTKIRGSIGRVSFECPSCHKSHFLEFKVVSCDEPKEEVEPMKFRKPSPQEVSQFARTKGYEVDGDYFCSYYESVGWKVGRKAMKSWKGAVHTFIRNQQAWGRSKYVKKIQTHSTVKVNVGYQH